MAIFRHREDRLPVALFAAYFAADLWVFATAESWWFPILWLILGFIPKGWISSWNHHHQHLPFFRPAWANRLLEMMFAFQTGVSSHAWYLHHVVGHHKNYLDQKLDESRWERRDGTTMRELEYAAYTAAMAYPVAWRVGKDYPKERMILASMLGVHVVLLGLAFGYRPYNAFFVLFLPSLVSLFLTAWATYFHHAGLRTDDHLEASYNVMHRGYNIATGNLGYHTAHHSRHGMHWSKLPAYHAKIEAGIPQNLYRTPGIPFKWSGTEAIVERPRLPAPLTGH